MTRDIRTLAATNSGSYWVVTLAWCALMAGGGYAAYKTIGLDVGGISVGAVTGTAVALWTGLSLRTFANTEYGTVFFFGRPSFVVSGGGLKLIPRGLFSVKLEPASVFQIELPGEPEDVQKTSDKEPLHVVEVKVDGKVVTKTKVRPIRITTKRPTGGDLKDPLNTQLTIEPSFWFRWRIVNPLLYQLQIGSPEEAAKQLRDLGETILTEKITQLTPVELTTGFTALLNDFRTACAVEVDKWGIEVAESGLNPIDYGKDIAVVLDNIGIEKGNVAVAESKAEQTRIKAAAERDRLAEEGRGRGIATENEIAGRGRGLKRAGKFVGVAPAEILAAEVAEKTIGEGDVIIGTDGVAQVLALGKLIMKKGNEKDGDATS